jgi:hypothetical protein
MIGTSEKNFENEDGKQCNEWHSFQRLNDLKLEEIAEELGIPFTCKESECCSNWCKYCRRYHYQYCHHLHHKQGDILNLIEEEIAPITLQF